MEKAVGHVTQQANWMIGISTLAAGKLGRKPINHFELRWRMSDSGSDLAAMLLNSLGWANYKMRNIPEALKFYGRVAGVPGPLQATCGTKHHFYQSRIRPSIAIIAAGEVFAGGAFSTPTVVHTPSLFSSDTTANFPDPVWSKHAGPIALDLRRLNRSQIDECRFDCNLFARFRAALRGDRRVGSLKADHPTAVASLFRQV